MDARYPSMLHKIAEKKAIDDEIRAELKKALAEFKERFAADVAAAKR